MYILQKLLFVFSIGLMICSCKQEYLDPVQDGENIEDQDSVSASEEFIISGVDISAFPEMSTENPIFYDIDGSEEEFLNILIKNGINTARLKLWVKPENKHNGFEEVMEFSKLLREKGFAIYLTLHYSDTWADPGKQYTPSQWSHLSFESLKDSVYAYTKNVTEKIKPEYIQIGNEINNGFLHPNGNIHDHFEQFKELLRSGIAAVRDAGMDTKIMIHYAGFDNSMQFYEPLSDLDYDIIALSYYPRWHGKSLTELTATLKNLNDRYKKDIFIAETAYPFTMGYDDNTHNIVGTDEDLILPEFPPTPEGQKAFLKNIKDIILNTEGGIGFAYWGAELIAWKGPEATDGSPWENQAIFDFENKALPIIQEFNLP